MPADQPQARQARQIARITTRYSAREDRLRLSVLDGNQTPINLWLTRRLSDRLVSSLVQCLEQQTTGGARTSQAPSPRQSGRTNAAEGAAAQLWEQTHADLSFKNVQPVVAPPEISETGLIETISIAQAGQGFRLHFAWDSETAVLAIAPMFLRQFLRIFHRNYVRAEWETSGVFPEWFADDAHQALIDKSSMN